MGCMVPWELSPVVDIPEVVYKAGLKTLKTMNVKIESEVAQSYPTLATPWTVWSMELSRPEYWSG